jgi:hypothetical protein
MTQPKFTTVDSSETRLDYKSYKFLLKEQSRGFYGAGKAIQLFQLDGLKKTHIKEIGWTKSDGTGPKRGEAFLEGIVTPADCKKAAVKYIDSII